MKFKSEVLPAILYVIGFYALVIGIIYGVSHKRDNETHEVFEKKNKQAAILTTAGVLIIILGILFRKLF